MSLPPVELELLRSVVLEQRGVVHETAERPDNILGASDEILHGPQVLEVRTETGRGAASPPDRAADLVRLGSGAIVMDAYPPAVGGQRLCHRAAEPPTGAGHQRSGPCLRDPFDLVIHTRRFVLSFLRRRRARAPQPDLLYFMRI